MDELKTMVEGIKKQIEEATENNDYRYFDDILDIEYFIGGNKDFRGVELTLTYGGPNIFVNTKTKEVKGYWGCSEYKRYISDEACNFIDSIFEEYITTII